MAAQYAADTERPEDERGLFQALAGELRDEQQRRAREVADLERTFRRTPGVEVSAATWGE